MALLRLLARVTFGAIFFTGGWGAVTNPGRRPDMVAKALPLPQPELMVRLNGAGMLAGATALGLGVRPRTAAVGLALLMLPTTYVGHQFWAQEDEVARRGQTVHFAKNVSQIGGLLTFALTDSD